MNDRGQVLAEFAVCSLAALALLLGTIDVARAVYTYHTVTDDARLATRYAIVNGATACAGGSPDPMQAFVNAQSFGLTPSLIVVTTSCPGGNTGCNDTTSPYSSQGCLVSVSVSYSFHFLVPLVSLIPIPMSASSQMVISQ